jgi:hypothetical protein
VKIPIVTSIDEAAIVDAAMRQCGLGDVAQREVFRLGVRTALLVISEEMGLRMETMAEELKVDLSPRVGMGDEGME